MFSKTKSIPVSKPPVVAPETSPQATDAQSLAHSARPSTSIIGANTQVQGDIHSEEDLRIEGRVKGTVTCKQHTVTLGSQGELEGDAHAHTLHVSGKVNGNLVALHKATVHKGAEVIGAIITPCLVLEDGSLFHGNIDMNPDNEIFEQVFASQPTSSTRKTPSQATSTKSTLPVETVSSEQPRTETSSSE
ncbi:bactofilin family protein [Vreelandella olivaria]|uniref:bactofilin family protein n=1 Tax=Vreelandella olivaria TaxID=390919 RepID=UPI00201F35F1|nr:polymer-forming cytoskeletal protein [Halomonas olivaria]